MTTDRLIRWESWRRRLRRWGWPVPGFMLPDSATRFCAVHFPYHCEHIQNGGAGRE